MKLKTKLSKLRHDGHITDAEYAIIINVLNKFSTQPPKTQPCEDCISRESVIEWLKDKDIIKTKNQEENAKRELAELPSVQPTRPTARWSRQTDTYHDYYECENCGIGVGLDDVRNFCPNCGARMGESEE